MALFINQLPMNEVLALFNALKSKTARTEAEERKLRICKERLIVYAVDNINALDEIEKEIREWQMDIHDNEYDAEEFDFVFDRIYEILADHRKGEE